MAHLNEKGEIVWKNKNEGFTADHQDNKVYGTVYSKKYPVPKEVVMVGGQEREKYNHDSDEYLPKIKIPVKISLLENAEIPKYSHSQDAGFDFVNYGEEQIIRVGETKLFKTGIRIALPLGYVLKVCSRSGLALKHNIHVLNSPGIVDSGYTNEIGVILHNTSNGDYIVRTGDRIAQGVLQEVEQCNFIKVDELEDTDRGLNGFGSTGK